MHPAKLRVLIVPNVCDVQQAVEGIVQFFKDKPNDEGYFALVDCNGNSKVHNRIAIPAMIMCSTRIKTLQSVVLNARKLGKSTYVFSVDPEKGQVAHANFVSEGARSKGIDARTWAAVVTEVVGGKVRPGERVECTVSLTRTHGRPEESRRVLKGLARMARRSTTLCRLQSLISIRRCRECITVGTNR